MNDYIANIRGLFPLLEANKNACILITTHHKPDADALGSSLGLYLFLRSQGFQNTQVVSPTDYGDFLKWMPGEPTILNWETQNRQSREWVEKADFTFCLDFNALHRINDMGNHVRASKAVKVMIDHHQEPEGFDDYRLWTTRACSTAQLIAELIEDWKGTEAMDAQMASCLYAGIMTDTGSFRFDSVTPDVHRLVARLMERGADHFRIHNLIYDSFSLNRMQFIGHVLAHKLEVLPEYHTAILSITREELQQYQIQTGDTEGLVNYGLGIAGIQLAALFVDRTKLVKISFRGKGTFPCNTFSRDHFKGGGHFSASGGQSEQTLEETIARFKELLPQYKSYLSAPKTSL